MPYSFSELHTSANKALDFFKTELSQFRTGRASVSMVDTVEVKAYGTTVKLNEVAQISTPEPNRMLIKPYDQSLLEAIEKAIQVSKLGINPAVHSDHVALTIPPLTMERRQELVKQVGIKTEEAKKMLRTLRTETKQDIESQKDDDGVSEDDIERDLEQLEKEIQLATSRIEEVAQKKVAELEKVG